MDTSKKAITSWWETAYLNGNLEQRFWMQAKAALPVGESLTHLDAVFDAMRLQRAVLRKNQRIEEWGQKAKGTGSERA